MFKKNCSKHSYRFFAGVVVKNKYGYFCQFLDKCIVCGVATYKTMPSDLSYAASHQLFDTREVAEQYLQLLDEAEGIRNRKSPKIELNRV